MSNIGDRTTESEPYAWGILLLSQCKPSIDMQKSYASPVIVCSGVCTQSGGPLVEKGMKFLGLVN